jgi:hypothetical protein
VSAIYDKYTVEKSVREHRKVVGPMDESKAVMAAMFEDGWRITRSGPYTDKKMFPKLDCTRFMFTAELEMEES